MDNEDKLESEEHIVEQRKRKFKEVFIKKNLWVYIALILLIFLAWHIRTSNIPQLKDITTGEYTLGPDLDPFLFLRYAKYIDDNGSIPKIDSMRNVPLGYNTAAETKLLPYMIAYFHKVLNLFYKSSIEYAAVIFPVFMFLLTVIAFFLFIRKIFEEKGKKGDLIALVATLFLIISPSLLARTVAGIPEKESVGFFFMFLSLYLFLSAWKAGSVKKSLIFGILAGISTILLSLVWGGLIYVFITIGLFTFVNFIFGAIDKKRMTAYFSWFIMTLSIPFIYSARYQWSGWVTSSSIIPSLSIFLILIIHSLIFNTKIKDVGIIKKIRWKLPDKVFSIIFFILIGVILSSLFLGIAFIPHFISHFIFDLRQPYSDRLSFTVAENRQPFFGEWKESFGPVIKNIPLLFWLFFVGSIFLFYETIKDLDKKHRYILLFFYVFFIFALIFSRYAPNSVMNGTSFFSLSLYALGFLSLIAGGAYLIYSYRKEGRLEELKKINISYLFLLAYFIPGIIGARSAIRLMMALAPPISGIVGFFSVVVIEKAMKQKEEVLKVVFFLLAALIIIATVYSVYYNYQMTSYSAKNMVPSVYTFQWQNAMAWVRNNTSTNAVFSHWWDYGYWIQSIGNRATVLDGGNAIPYWDYLMGRYVLTGQNEREALEFLYTHDATHLLIDSTEVGKYSAYSNIGSDENYDRYSWISSFFLDERSTRETNNETAYLYTGGTVLDEDYIIKQDNKEILLPGRSAGVGALVFKIGKNGEIEQPQVIFVYQNSQYTLSLRYAYYNNKLYDFKSGYEGGAYIIKQIVQQGQGITINEKGVALFLSERNMRALWVKLYLLGEGTNFKLVHNEPDYVIRDLKKQGLDVGDFVYYGGLRGPIKIWEIEYPSDIQKKQEYLEINYPNPALSEAKVF